MEAVPLRDRPSPVSVRDHQNTPGADKAIFADEAMCKAAVYQTKTAMDHKALDATQLNEENKNHKYTIDDWKSIPALTKGEPEKAK